MPHRVDAGDGGETASEKENVMRIKGGCGEQRGKILTETPGPLKSLAPGGGAKRGGSTAPGSLNPEDEGATVVGAQKGEELGRTRGIGYEWRFWHHNHWRQYETEISQMLEDAFVAGKKVVEFDLRTDSVCTSERGFCKYVVNFERHAFTQTNKITGYVRPIKRARATDFSLPPWNYQTQMKQRMQDQSEDSTEEPLIFDIAVPTTQPVVADYLRKKVEVEGDEMDTLRRQLESMSVSSVSMSVKADLITLLRQFAFPH